MIWIFAHIARLTICHYVYIIIMNFLFLVISILILLDIVLYYYTILLLCRSTHLYILFLCPLRLFASSLSSSMFSFLLLRGGEIVHKLPSILVPEIFCPSDLFFIFHEFLPPVILSFVFHSFWSQWFFQNIFSLLFFKVYF